MALNSTETLLAAVAALVAVLLAIRYWRGAILATFVLLIFEGALRKWVFPSAQAQIYLIKDIILLGAYLGFIIDGGMNRPAATGVGVIKAALVLSFVYGCVEILNPNSPSILVGLMGLKAYLVYAPLAFILPHIFRSREDFFRLIRFYLLIAIPVAILGFVQVASGDTFLNSYVGEDESGKNLARFGEGMDVVRTSGTFSYISGYTTFLSITAFIAIAYNMSQGWRLKNNLLPLVALPLVVGAMFTTGSRGPVFILIAVAPFILLFALKERMFSTQTAVRLCLLAPLIIILALNVSPKAFQAFADRAGEADLSYTLARLFSPVTQLIDALSNAPVIGVGIGAAQNSALALMGATSMWWLGDDLMFEEESARVTVELGFIGFLLVYTVRVAILVFAIRCMNSFKDPGYRAFGIILVPYFVLGIIGQVIVNVTADFYYWAAFGLLLAMRRLEQSARVGAAKQLVQRRLRLSRGPVPAK
jgi:hypothetical protein